MKNLNQEKVLIYDLSCPSFLIEDINYIHNRILELYEIIYRSGSYTLISRTIAEENKIKETFNKLVPNLKSLVKDMYSIIEGVCKAQDGEFKKLDLEEEYEYLKEFRVLNNKFKHHNDRESRINPTAIAKFDFSFYRIDCNFQFWYIKEDYRFTVGVSDLILTFYQVLKDKNIIEL